MLMKATRWLGSMGARTDNEVLSIALATSGPNLSFTALMMAVTVVKSPSRTLMMSWSALAKGFSTTRSTVAPPGTRAAVVTPVETLEPEPLAETLVAVKGP